jgi:hypothetical protein
METGGGDIRGRVLLGLAALGAVVCIALGVAFGFSVRGYPIDDLGVLTLGVPLVALLSLLLIIALVYLGSEVSRRHFRLTAFLPPIVIVVGVVLGWRAPRFVASRQPYWAEKVFWTHHEEFMELAEWASAECSDDDDFSLDAASFYEEAWADCGSSGLEEIEFTIRRAQHMVVFTPVESRDDAHDPCFQSHARYLIKKLEDHWYLCGWTTD